MNDFREGVFPSRGADSGSSRDDIIYSYWSELFVLFGNNKLSDF